MLASFVQIFFHNFSVYVYHLTFGSLIQCDSLQKFEAKRENIFAKSSENNISNGCLKLLNCYNVLVTKLDKLSATKFSSTFSDANVVKNTILKKNRSVWKFHSYWFFLWTSITKKGRFLFNAETFNLKLERKSWYAETSKKRL